MAGQNGNTKMLLHFGGADASTGITDEISAARTISVTGNAQIDTDQAGPFAVSSGTLLLDGTGDSINTAHTSDFDIYADAAKSYTLDFWSRILAQDNGDYFCADRKDDNNRWIVSMSVPGGLRVALISSSSLTLSVTGGTLTNNVWQHIAIILVPKGDNTWHLGGYIGGQQVFYKNQTTGLILSSGNFIIGSDAVDGSASNYYGNMSEFRVQHDNYFGALPNVGLTNTITVPTKPYSTFAGSQAIFIK